MQHYKIHEYTLATKTIDISDTAATPVDNKCYKYFDEIRALKLPATGWEIDSNGNRIGLFFHNQEAISKMVTFLKIKESDVEMLGVFYSLTGDKTIRIIKKYKGPEFDGCGINWYSYNYDKPDEVSYELRATLDIAKFISNEDIAAIKGTIPGAQQLSHIKVRNGELIKVYFIEYPKLKNEGVADVRREN